MSSTRAVIDSNHDYASLSEWSLHINDITGSVEVGKWADMIILNHNLFEIPKTEIDNTEVQKTLFKGKVVYQAD